MIRLKYNEKPSDPQLSVSQKLDGWNSESDVVWMTWDEWFDKGIDVDEHPDDVPDEIKQFIPKWREEAAEVDRNATDVDFWPVKHAESKVYYNDKCYCVDVGILHGIGNRYTIDWLFERVARTIENDMYSIGATYVRYMGMLD